jgi:hypothetical protein
MRLRVHEIFSFIISRKGRTFLRVWIRECCRDFIEKLISGNVIREIRFENIPKEKIMSIFADLDDYIETRKKRGCKAVEQVKGFAKEMKYGKHLCSGKEVDIEEVTTVSRVVLTGDMVSFVTREKSDQYLDDSADSEIGYQDLKEEIEKCKKSKRPFGILRGELPIIWVTKSSELGHIKENSLPQHMADEVAKNLGLCHAKKGYLVEIQIPLQALDSLHTPTVVDADFSECFCPAREPDRWGRTLCLGSRTPNLPEAVHASIRFRDDFGLFSLGKLGSLQEENLTGDSPAEFTG